jgi:hypothetical protein
MSIMTGWGAIAIRRKTDFLGEDVIASGICGRKK